VTGMVRAEQGGPGRLVVGVCSRLQEAVFGAAGDVLVQRSVWDFGGGCWAGRVQCVGGMAIRRSSVVG
jgi:hypothetical protein